MAGAWKQDLEARVASEFGFRLSQPVQKRLWKAFEKRFGEDVHEVARADLRELVIEVASIPESYFFRDPSLWRWIRDHLSRIFPAHGPLRAWSVGCARGEEIYSLRLLLEEAPEGNRAQLFASDMSPEMLAATRLGVYSDWSLRGLPERFRFHFQTRDEQFVLRPSERGITVRTFPYLLPKDLLPKELQAPRSVHMILCRNVLIYMDPEAIEKTFDLFYRQLAPGGLLFLAPSDPWPSNLHWTQVVDGQAIFQRKGEALPWVPEVAAERLRSSPGSSPGRVAKSPPPAAPSPGGPPPERSSELPGFLDREGSQAPSLPLALPAKREGHGASSLEVCPPPPSLGSSNSEPPSPESAELFDPNPGAVGHAQRLIGLGRPEDAEGVLKDLLVQNPLRIDAHYLLGEVALAIHDLEAAEKYLRKTLYLEPDHPGAALALYRVLGKQGKDQEAEKYLEWARRSLEYLEPNDLAGSGSDLTVSQFEEVLEQILKTKRNSRG